MIDGGGTNTANGFSRREREIDYRLNELADFLRAQPKECFLYRKEIGEAMNELKQDLNHWKMRLYVVMAVLGFLAPFAGAALMKKLGW